MWSQELDLISVSSFQLKIFYDSMTLWSDLTFSDVLAVLGQSSPATFELHDSHLDGNKIF